MIVKFNTAFEEGEIVYVKTDPNQFKRIVIGYYYSSGVVKYTLDVNGEVVANFSEYEISKEPSEVHEMGGGDDVY